METTSEPTETSHNDIIDTERTYFTIADAHQFGVGQIELHSMAYASDTRLCFAAKVSVRSLKSEKDQTGWGETIFQGSLEELIDLITEAKEHKHANI